MRFIKLLFFWHLAALMFGLGGLLIALPHPELWDNSPFAVEVFNFGIRYAGSLHILFGTATMLLFGLLCVGVRKTLIFFAAATTISLSMELLGTSTGFPFGAYAYTSFLGFKVADHVPYSIPLSWFYMGFTSYLLASLIVSRLKLRRQTIWSLLLGVYFLTVWDLVLDPSMASQHLPIRFWIWYESGPYFGMPVRNLVGWSVTGLIFMGVSRLLWRTNLDTRHIASWLPFGVYAANTSFAIILSLSAGLWLPTLMAVILGLVPASLALLLQPSGKVRPAVKANNTLSRRVASLAIRAGSRAISRHNIKVEVEGLEYVPGCGPVLIAARHFHHLYDGCALLGAVPRQLHILVALDWVQKRWVRSLMERACTLAGWPIVLRSERLSGNAGECTKAGCSVYAPGESRRYLRSAVMDSLQLLRHEEVLVVFPEAYPNIDPTFTPKNANSDFLPFQPGFARLVEMAEKDGCTQVAIVPAGLTYVKNRYWHITLRFGPPLLRRDYRDSMQLVHAVEERVRALSPAVAAPAHIEEVIRL